MCLFIFAYIYFIHFKLAGNAANNYPDAYFVAT